MTIYDQLMQKAACWPHDVRQDWEGDRLVLVECLQFCRRCQLEALAKHVCAEAQKQLDDEKYVQGDVLVGIESVDIEGMKPRHHRRPKMMQTKLLFLLLGLWLWYSPKLYHHADSECPRTPIAQPCIGIERVDAD